MLEKYIVEDLIGADLKHLFGNVVTDPQTRLVLIRAIDEIHGGETAGTFVNGNTVYTQDAEKNVSILTTCLLFDIIGQLKKAYPDIENLRQEHWSKTNRRFLDSLFLGNPQL